MRKQLLVGLVVMAFISLASSASAQTWTAVGSSGDIEDNSATTYATNNGALFFRSLATGNVNAIFNVTNPRDTSSSPSWTTLEFVAKNPGGGLGVYATATLYSQPRASATTSAICTAIAPATGGPLDEHLHLLVLDLRLRQQLLLRPGELGPRKHRAIGSRLRRPSLLV